MSSIRCAAVVPTVASALVAASAVYRASRLRHAAIGLLVLVAGHSQASAAMLYVGGVNYGTGRATFGKVDVDTGVYTQINGNLGTSSEYFTGLTWNPNIDAFYSMQVSGQVKTITTTGVVGTTIANTGISNGRLAYDSATSQLYQLDRANLNQLDTSTGQLSLVGNMQVTPPGYGSLFGAALLNGTLYATLDAGYPDSGGPVSDYRFGTVDRNTGRFTAISQANSAFFSLSISSEGGVMYGVSLFGGNIYTIDAATGAPTMLRTITGLDGVLVRSVFAMPSTVPAPGAAALIGLVAAVGSRRRRA